LCYFADLVQFSLHGSSYFYFHRADIGSSLAVQHIFVAFSMRFLQMPQFPFTSIFSVLFTANPETAPNIKRGTKHKTFVFNFSIKILE